MDERIGSYNFFISLLFELPNKVLIKKILSLDSDVEAVGMDHLKEYIESVEGRDTEDILTEISVDRTYLLHGLSEQGPRPPYESIYLKISEETEKLDIMRSISQIYKKAGFVLGKEAHQPHDHIGVEMAFMEQLLRCGDVTSEVQKDFFSNHLGKWGTLYAREIVKFAKTGFWRSIGYLLEAFLEEEAGFYT